MDLYSRVFFDEKIREISFWQRFGRRAGGHFRETMSAPSVFPKAEILRETHWRCFLLGNQAAALSIL
jgi:hypothetical protein